MRCLIMTVLAVAIVTVRSQEVEERQVCMPNSTFKMECNDCFCSPDGKHMGCTFMICHSLPNASPVRIGRDVTEFQTCIPGEVKLEDCQACTCLANGSRFFCAGKTCDERKRSQSTTCQHGQIKMDGCNRCTCTGIVEENESSWVCEELPCVEKQRQTREVQQQVCQPGETKKQDCNSCFCLANGTGWGCTLMACPKISYTPVSNQNDDAKKSGELLREPLYSGKQA